MKIYNYDDFTKEFLQESKAILSPLEKDVFLIPANATTTKPPLKKDGFARCFISDKWEYIKDLRGQEYHTLEDGELLYIDYLGELKENHILGTYKPTEEEIKEDKKQEILISLSLLDTKKTRALTDALINNDLSFLQELEEQAETLRQELKAL